MLPVCDADLVKAMCVRVLLPCRLGAYYVGPVFTDKVVLVAPFFKCVSDVGSSDNDESAC